MKKKEVVLVVIGVIVVIFGFYIALSSPKYVGLMPAEGVPAGPMGWKDWICPGMCHNADDSITCTIIRENGDTDTLAPGEMKDCDAFVSCGDLRIELCPPGQVYKIPGCCTGMFNSDYAHPIVLVGIGCPFGTSGCVDEW